MPTDDAARGSLSAAFGSPAKARPCAADAAKTSTKSVEIVFTGGEALS